MNGALDSARALALKQRGHLFVRGVPRRLPPRLALTGEADALPAEWGSLNRRLYHMFHGTVLPTILRNFDRLAMAHGIEVRMPFMDYRLVGFTMALPDESKVANGYTKMVARRAMANAMPESIRMNARKIGFNSPMPAWLNGPLAPWVEALTSERVPAFEELCDVAEFNERVLSLTRRRAWDWVSSGRIWPYLHMKWTLAKQL